MDNKKRDAGLDPTTAPTAEPNTHKTGKNYLLCIGIDEYAHCPRLNNAVKDAKDFKNLLTERYLFEEGDCVEIHNKAATRKNIEKELRSLAQMVTKQDNVIIFFSGHGEFDKVLKRGYWIPTEAEKGDYSDYVSNSTIRDLLNAINSHHTFLIADSCFSGSLFSSKDVNRSIADRLEEDPSRWGLTAGRNEIVDDGKPGTNSPFAEKLLDLLRKNEKPLGVAELCAKLMEIVPANASQTPRGEPLKIEGHEGGQFVFHLRKKVDTALEAAQRKAQDENAAFERAKQEATGYALERFVLKYGKNSPFYKDALDLLEAIEEKEAWEAAERKGKLTAYLRFQEDYKDGKYAKLCTERIEAIRHKTTPTPIPEKVMVPPPVVPAIITQPVAPNPSHLLPFEPETIRVEGGTFKMGGTEEQGHDVVENEKPVRNITLSTYAIGKYPVIVGQYLAFCEDTNGNWPEWLENGNSYHVESGTNDVYKNCGYKRNGAELLPIAGISWDDAVAYCNWLSSRTNKNYRLPTEVEWEYAARGGTKSKGFKYSGGNNLGAVGWYDENSSSKPKQVGSKQANELGIYDMSGNVWEWCKDWYDVYKGSDLHNPQGASKGDNRVLRGGSWSDFALYCRVSIRGRSAPTIRYNNLGFRVALQ